MNGNQLREIRERLKLSQVALGFLIGYAGNANTVGVRIRRLEAGEAIPLYIARLIWMYDMHGTPLRWRRAAIIDAGDKEG